MNYYISEKPYTYAPFNAGSSFSEMSDLVHIRAGYEQFVMDGVKRYEFFNSLFMGKGWIWYFKLGKLYVKERGGNNLSSTVLDYQTDFISHSVSSDILDKQVDNVHVFNGNYYDNGSINSALQLGKVGGGKYYLGGAIRHVVSNIETWSKVRPFVRLEFRTSPGNRYLLNFATLDYSRYTGDTDRDFIRSRVTNGSNQYLLDPVERGSLNFANQRTLEIKPIECSADNTAGLDLNLARSNSNGFYGDGNFYSVALQHTDTQIFCKGTPAAAMIRLDEDTSTFYTYEVDCRKEPFINNFKKFIRSANPILFDVEVYGVITEPYQNITITNYPYDNSISTKAFSIQRLSFNDRNKTSKLTLQMI